MTTDLEGPALWRAHIGLLLILYDAKGDLLFKGGVTGSRGHEGDNLGIEALRASIDTGRPAPRGSLVFGCALSGSDIVQPAATQKRED